MIQTEKVDTVAMHQEAQRMRVEADGILVAVGCPVYHAWQVLRNETLFRNALPTNSTARAAVNHKIQEIERALKLKDRAEKIDVAARAAVVVRS